MKKRTNKNPVSIASRLPCPAYHGDEPYIYVCYKHSDYKLAYIEIERLHEAGYNICFDEGIVPENDVSEEIFSDIRNCSMFIALITPGFDKNRYVQNQIKLAMKEKKTFLSIYLSKTDLTPEWNLRLGCTNSIHKESMSEEGYNNRLNTSIEKMIGAKKSICEIESKADDLPSGKKASLFSSLFLRKNKKSAPVSISNVQFSALAPESIKRSEYTIIDIMMYEQEFRHTVDELITHSETHVKETKSGVIKVKNASSVRVVLTSPDVEIDDNNLTQQWNGGYLRFQFAVILSDDYAKKQIFFNTDIYINGVIATKLKFVLLCDTNVKQKPEIIREDVLSAFVSYASKDRKRVASIVQGMGKARPDMDIFFDIESLRSGDDWKSVLTKEIDKRDVLFLCWSDNASKSEWVDYEWRYALKQKGIESIEPIPLVSPEKCPPPTELNVKHFNDKLLYVIN